MGKMKGWKRDGKMRIHAEGGRIKREPGREKGGEERRIRTKKEEKRRK